MTLVRPGAKPDLDEASRRLEAMLLERVFTASGAFHGSDAAGSSLHASQFVEVLADAVAKSGGLGLAGDLARSVQPHGHGAGPASSLPALASARVTSPFGDRADPFDGHLAHHAGVDLAVPEGAPVRAVAGGVVRRAGPSGGLGEAVEIDHGDGTTTVYGHASELLVGVGDRVLPGDEIARAGHTGRATGPHVHFELRRNGRSVDPSLALKTGAVRVEDTTRPR